MDSPAPPAKPRRVVASGPAPIGDALRAAILASGLAPHALSRRSGLPPSVVHALVHGGDCRLSTVDALAGPLGLALAVLPRRGRPRRKPTPP